MPSPGGPELWPWVYTSGGFFGGVVAAWLKYRQNKDTAGAAKEKTALESWKELAEENREERHEMREEINALRAEHAACKQKLEDAEKDLADLRSDLTVLQGLVVTQIEQEAARPDDTHRRREHRRSDEKGNGGLSLD